MNELIKIENSNGINTVNARDFWIFLESKRKFADWIKDRIRQYDFVEEKDFITIVRNRSTTGIGRGLKEYHISIQMAKELSMVENNSRGKEARKYFIACETKLKEMSLPKTYGEALLEAGKLAIKNEKLQIENTTMLPKADFFDAVTGSKDAIEMSQVAKILDNGIGRNLLFKLLRKSNILRYNNEPYQEYVDRGYFRVVEQKYVKADGDVKVNIKTLVYQKGLDFIRRTLEE